MSSAYLQSPWLRRISYGLSLIFISLWTLLRFFDQRSIFDLVSQQVVVHQWLHSSLTSTQMGLTAYIPKMLLLYVPLDLLPGSPRLKLMLLTLAINIATFLLIAYFCEKILALYRLRAQPWLYLGLMWFAVISGSVFWISFANSRNLEVAGGVALWYVALCLMQAPTLRASAWLGLGCGVLFFADPLQFYMAALPLLLYCAGLIIRKKLRWQVGLYVLGSFVSGLIISKLLFALAGHFLELHFSGAQNKPYLGFEWLKVSTGGVVRSTLTLFAGANDAGKVRQIANLGLLSCGAILFFSAALKRRLPSRFVLFVGCIWLGDSLIYILSGQAAQPDTSRYLIMLAPAALLVAGSYPAAKTSRVVPAIGVGGVLFLNIVTLTVTFWQNADLGFPKDAHIASAHRYISAHPGQQPYASDDTAMPAQYYYRLAASQLLPVGCLQGSLVRTHYSMDAAFAATIHSDKVVAIIFDGDAITNTPNICTPDSVNHQLGAPQAITHTDDGSLVELFPARAAQFIADH